MEKYIVKLKKSEREELLSLIKTGKSAASRLMHARAILMADENDTEQMRRTDEEIASALHIASKTVARLRKQFIEDGLEATLSRKPHANPKGRKMDGEQEAHLIALCCTKPPEGHNHWTLKLLANKLVQMEIIDSISSTTVGRMLKKNELKPWQKKEWCIPPEANADFVYKMEDVLDIYKRPYDEKKPLICMDETSKQLIKETRKPITISPGNPERYDTEYERNGVRDVFIALEPLAGKRKVKITETRKKNRLGSLHQGTC